MHDPMTVAFNVRLPLPWKRANNLYKDKRREWQFVDLATIWHVDPEKDGSDDSCGWFMRSRHGDRAVLEKIVKHFEEDWDRIFQPSKEDHDPDDGPYDGKTYFCGLFKPDGDPNLSVHGIVLNLFLVAANVHFESDGRTSWKKSKAWMQKNIFDILLFAENPVDSLFDGITRKFEKGCNESHTPQRRQERIRSMASCIYSWILREQRPWYRHPKWHIHHWRIQIHFLQKLKRWLFARCCKCQKGFKWNESVIGSWSGKEIWHDRCESSKPISH